MTSPSMGFLPMALLKAEPGASVRVEMMEGGWESGDGAACLELHLQRHTRGGRLLAPASWTPNGAAVGRPTWPFAIR